MTTDGRTHASVLDGESPRSDLRRDGNGAAGSGLPPVNQVIVFHPKRLPMARLVDVQEHTEEAQCTICGGDKVLPVISKIGEPVHEVECPFCGGTGCAQ